MSDRDVDFTGLVSNTSPDRCKGPGDSYKECQALYVKSIDQDKRQITALASTGDLDRTDEIIQPEAFKEMLPRYLKNPVVLTSHQHQLESGSSSVVGNAVKAWIDKQGLWVVIEFVKGTALGEEYWLLYSTKKQRALSVGFKEHEGGYEDHDGKRVWVWTKIELLEISCVPVPANPNALSKSRQHKFTFVEAKRQERAAEQLLAEIRAEDPEFDAKCKEFAEIISGFENDALEGQHIEKRVSVAEHMDKVGDVIRTMLGSDELYRKYAKYREYKSRGYSCNTLCTEEESKVFDAITKGDLAGAKAVISEQCPSWFDTEIKASEFAKLVSRPGR